VTLSNALRPALLLLMAALALAPRMLQAQDAASEAPAGVPSILGAGDDKAGPVVLTANQLVYDSRRKLVTATGNVELSRDARRLLADSIRYDQIANKVFATGNVVMIEESGDAFFGDEMEITGDLREGFINGVRALLSDDSRAAGNRGTRKAGNITEINKAVYSPCELCADGSPLWQIHATKVTHDQKEQMVYFDNAVLEFFGIPVAYTPYLSGPDPTVKRKSGFLAPRFSSNSELGFTVQTPYYYTFAPNRDVTIAPLFTTNSGTVLAGEVRDLETFGKTELRGSITYTDTFDDDTGDPTGKGIRGNLSGRGRYTIDETHPAGFDLDVTSDNTYLKRYDIKNSSILNNHAYVQQIEDLDYAAADAWAFQGLRDDDDQELIPFALPWLQSRQRSGPMLWGSHWTLDNSFLALTRTGKGGLDTRRLSNTLGWQLPWMGNLGDVWRFGLSLRGDVYNTNGFRTDSDPDGTALGDANENTVGRLLPKATLDWSYPLVADAGLWQQTLEPVIHVNVAPTGNNPNSIPNEDSIDFEFDETNLLEADRFTGLDLNDGGSRLAYAMRYGLYGPAFWSINTILGQSIAFNGNDAYPSNSGLDQTLSDYVGAIQLRPADTLDLAYRFRLTKQDLKLARSDLTLGLGPPRLRFNIKYIKLDSESSYRDQGSQFGRKEIIAGVRYQMFDSLALAAQTRRDLKEDATIANTFGLVYTNPCLVLVAGLQKDFTEQGELDKPLTFTVRLILTNLGQVQAGEGLFGL
jgi:LPS-assembly protein